MLKQTLELLSFKAFRPDRSDVRVSLSVRVGQESVMGVLMSSRYVVCARIEFKANEIVIGDCESFVLGNESDKVRTLSTFAKERGLSSLVLLGSPDFQAIRSEKAVAHNKVDSLDYNESKLNTILGEPREEGRGYTYLSNPRASESLIFSYKQEKVDVLVNIAKKAELEVLRTTCGIYATLDHLMHERPEILSKDQLLLLYASGTVFVASIVDHQFCNIGFRSKVYFKELDQIVPRMIERFGKEHDQVTYVNCSDWDLHEFFLSNYSQMKIVPAFEDCRKGVFLAACHG